MENKQIVLNEEDLIIIEIMQEEAQSINHYKSIDGKFYTTIYYLKKNESNK
jgi:hypothetical protein